jgi:hypothetical protein
MPGGDSFTELGRGKGGGGLESQLATNGLLAQAGHPWLTQKHLNCPVQAPAQEQKWMGSTQGQVSAQELMLPLQ